MTLPEFEGAPPNDFLVLNATGLRKPNYELDRQTARNGVI